MIATLHGDITEKSQPLVVIECGGVGYGVMVCSIDFEKLVIGEKPKLYIHEHIKEDTHDLYGFLLADTKRLYEQLIGVKNVGPKVALAILDIGPSEAIRAGIAGGDVKFLQTAKGVGKRAAEQIVVELRDKVGFQTGGAAENIVYRSGVDSQDEAVQALLALGFTESDAHHALQDIDPALPLEERIKKALKK